jgi:hypothetical protein
MNKKSFRVDFLPINHFLIGFSYQSGVCEEQYAFGMDVDVFTIGFGIINFSYNRFYETK